MASRDHTPTFPQAQSDPFQGHIRKGDTIFGVHYGSAQFLLDIPAPQDAKCPDFSLLDGHFNRVSWVSPITPCLLFLPRDTPFHGALFGRLRVPPAGLPVVKAEEGWILEPQLAKSWRELESALRHVLDAMCLAARSGERYPFPLQYGYNLAHQSRHAVTRVARQAHNAFLPLMATISMMFAILDHENYPSWRDQIIEASGVHAQWFADLQVSPVGDMTIPRVGGILDLRNQSDPVHTFDAILPVIFGKLPIPLYFHWGDASAFTGKPTFRIPDALKDRGFYPAVEEITYLRGLPGKVAFSSWQRAPTGRMYSDRVKKPYVPRPVLKNVDAQSATGTVPHFPQPEKDSGQRYGENVHAFFVRRKARNEEIAAQETPKMREECLQREAHAAKGSAPGRKGERVFVWEEEDGFFIRRAINRDLAAQMWDEFTPNQHLYDGFHKQWDLCVALAPNEEAENSDDEYDGDDTDLACSEIQGIPLPEVPAGEVSTEQDLWRCHDLEHRETMFETEEEHETYQDISHVPHARFGFTEPVATATYATKPVEAKICRKSLGDEKWSGLQQAQYRHLPVLLAYLLTAKSIVDIPRELLDLRQPGSGIPLQSNCAINVSLEHLNGSPFYILTPKGFAAEDYPRYILLSSAATALQVIRMGWGPDPQEIIFHLLEHGVEFRVCCRDAIGIAPEPPLVFRYSGLGYRRAGYTPTFEDYGVYMDLRGSFFDCPRGRAALFAGGIVGRLAQDRVNEDLASLGPTTDVFMTEIGLICGVYDVGTGHVNKTNDDPQTSRISWWPLPHAFRSSGLNTGWWSPDCEVWFQQRQAAIKRGTAKLLTQTEWKHVTKYYKKTREVAIASEMVAGQFLRRQGLDLELGFLHRGLTCPSQTTLKTRPASQLLQSTKPLARGSHSTFLKCNSLCESSKRLRCSYFVSASLPIDRDRRYALSPLIPAAQSLVDGDSFQENKTAEHPPSPAPNPAPPPPTDPALVTSPSTSYRHRLSPRVQVARRLVARPELVLLDQHPRRPLSVRGSSSARPFQGILAAGRPAHGLSAQEMLLRSALLRAGSSSNALVPHDPSLATPRRLLLTRAFRGI
ncbi:hypothetical protein DFH07DRAFT_968786 [Mycena maculata]|uniref:Uncharacterized protein n=1 Tax=Mycena maculata TaxID=230809 RepID=A0AAD7MTJ7_9AGAR|nr:hypothetical protein DFH07DRAFT_968786 [Mycena maculata]